MQISLGSVNASPFARLLSLNLGIQWAGCALAVIFKTEKFYDLFGSLTFLALVHLSHQWSTQTARQTIQSHLVMAWTSRLGMFLFIRILRDGKDPRFTRAKEQPLVFLAFWTLQALWVFVTALPTLILNEQSTASKPIGLRDYVGWGMWGVGMFFEVVADYQKNEFRRNPDNKNKFITAGLWSISRHPNYFGEILLWFGLYVSASSVFRGWQHLSVLSPVFVHLLITRGTGVPLLEKAGLKKWGHSAEYQRYVRDTPPLVPFMNW